MPVSPSSSVTVNRTVYVQSAANVCVAEDPVPVEPSPKFHAYPVIVPSGSLDPAPDTVTVRSLTVGVPITAVGAWFGGGVADTAGADHENSHCASFRCYFLRALPTSWPAITRPRAMTNIENPMTLAWAGIPRRYET